MLGDGVAVAGDRGRVQAVDEDDDLASGKVSLRLEWSSSQPMISQSEPSGSLQCVKSDC